MKSLHCSVKVDERHGECSIIGQVARQVDEVLARVLDGLDIWDFVWMQDEATGEELREQGYRTQVPASSEEDYGVKVGHGLHLVSIFKPYYIFFSCSANGDLVIFCCG